MYVYSYTFRDKRGYVLSDDKLFNEDVAEMCSFEYELLLSGRHRGKIFLYNTKYNKIFEPLMLSVYLHLTIRNYYKPELEKSIKSEHIKKFINKCGNGIDLVEILEFKFKHMKRGVNRGK